MLQRFMAGSAVASVAIAIGATAMLLMSATTLGRFYPVAHLWCFAPVAWGLWAMVTPPKWMPHRLPEWGAILGLIAGAVVVVLNIPARVLGTTVPVSTRVVGAVLVVVMYYLLWMVVRSAYMSLTAAAAAPPPQGRGKAAKA